MDSCDRPTAEANADFVVEAVPEGARSQTLARLLSMGVEGGADPTLSAWMESGWREALYWARRDGDVLGSCWAREVPGGVVDVVPPRCSAAASPEVYQRLAAQLAVFLDACRESRLAQALVSRAAVPAVSALTRHGFERIANLVWLGTAPGAPPAGELQLLPCTAADETRLREVWSATCEGSLDCQVCPPLAISASDSFARYRYRSHDRCEHWYLLREQGQDVGCLILDSPRAGEPLDLLYLGIVPAVRGRSYGAAALLAARSLAARLGRPLMSAVDESNWPALRAYRRAGFLAFARQQLYLKRLVPCRP